MYLELTKLVSQHFSLMGFLPVCNIFQVIGSDRPWYSDESVWRLHYFSLFGQPGFCLIFILSKNNVFQSGTLLKMPPSSSFMKHTKKCRFQLGNLSMTKKTEVKTKTVDSMIFGIHCSTCFQQTSSFPKFSVKIGCEKI